MSEADLAAKIVARFEAESWKVYQEVDPKILGAGRADIVATRGPELVVIEAKKALSFDVLAQAVRWKPYASTVFVACASAKESRGRELAWKVVEMFGLGLFEVKSLWPLEEQRGQSAIAEVVKPPFPRSFHPALRDALHDGHQTHARAGTNKGGQFSRFKQTVEALARHAEAHPGELLRVALSRTDHHYKSIGIGIERLTAQMAEVEKLGVRLVDGVGGHRIFPATANEEAS